MPKTWKRRASRASLVARAPELVPLRMINESLYCERLVYLEWSQGEFQHNYFTLDGRAVHARPDAGQGRLPFPPTADAAADDDDGEPIEDERPYVARSVWLSSESLGMTGKIDVVEGDGGEVTPIEYKRGHAPARPEGAYLPELAQVCAQVLLLREHGFRCEHGEIYFAADRRRVHIEITPALIETTRAAVGRVRELTERGELPPPLQGSPKCGGCSLVGICLPDEVEHLKRLDESTGQLALDLEAPPDTAVRRLHPSADERHPLYVQSFTGKVGIDGLRIIIETKEGTGEARLPQTSHVCVYGNVQVTTQAIAAFLEREVPLLYFSYGGWYRGRILAEGHKNIELRVAQHAAFSDLDATLELARRVVASKILNSRTLLRRNHASPSEVSLKELEILARTAQAAESRESLLGIEGAAARLYFQSFKGMLKADLGFDFTSRNRRPPRDPVNALLSFAYGLLTKDLVLAVASVGLEPLLGFYHQPRYGRPALALDLMEEMRPLIADSVVLQVLNTGVVGPTDFELGSGSCAMKSAARKRVIQAYERRMESEVTHPVFGYRISYRRVLEVQARLLGRWLLGEIDTFPSFRTR